jgi:hypothetical protein
VSFSIPDPPSGDPHILLRPDWLLSSQLIPNKLKFTLTTIINFCLDPQYRLRTAKPTLEQIAVLTGICQSTARKHLAQLQNMGLIRRWQEISGGPWVIELLFDPSEPPDIPAPRKFPLSIAVVDDTEPT